VRHLPAELGHGRHRAQALPHGQRDIVPEPLLQALDHFGAARVVPGNDGAQRQAGAVEGSAALRQPGDAHRHHARQPTAELFQRLRHRRQQGLDAGLHAIVRRREGCGPHCHTDLGTGGVDQDGLGAAGTDVDAEEEGRGVVDRERYSPTTLAGSRRLILSSPPRRA